MKRNRALRTHQQKCTPPSLPITAVWEIADHLRKLLYGAENSVLLFLNTNHNIVANVFVLQEVIDALSGASNRGINIRVCIANLIQPPDGIIPIHPDLSTVVMECTENVTVLSNKLPLPFNTPSFICIDYADDACNGYAEIDQVGLMGVIHSEQMKNPMVKLAAGHVARRMHSFDKFLKRIGV